MKILFLTNIPSPYRVDFFNELGKLAELTVLFETAASDERDSSWKRYHFENFQGIVMKGKKTSKNTAFCSEVIKHLRRKWDHIIVADATTRTGMLAIQYMKDRRIPYWIEGDGGFAKTGKGFKERIKRHFISGAKGYFSTSKAHDSYYLTYGADSSRIHRYPFTSISNEYIKQAQNFTGSDRQSLREELDMTEKSVILSVGRFSYKEGYGKGYDILLRIAESMGEEYGFFIVGDEPTSEFLQWKEERHLSNVHFVGFKQRDELAKYYAASDVFVLLSRGEAWGLVINEAMAHGLPIVASDRCVAATELIENGGNGYVVSLDNEEDVEKKLRQSIDNRQLLGVASQKRIGAYTIEKMAERHYEILLNA